MKITTHAAVRCGQRGFPETDLGLIAQYGTLTDQGFLLTGNDIVEAERRFKKRLDRLSMLQDVFMPTTDDGGTAKKRPSAQQRSRGGARLAVGDRLHRFWSGDARGRHNGPHDGNSRLNGRFPLSGGDPRCSRAVYENRACIQR